MDYARLRCLYVDIMHRPEREFYRATVREILSRWDCYAECKGYKEPVQEVIEVVEE